MPLTAAEIDDLKKALVTVETLTQEIAKKIANDPKALGELASAGKSLADIPDVVPAPFTIRIASLVLRAIVDLHDGGVACVPADQTSAAAAAAVETKSVDAGAVQSGNASSWADVAKSGPNRKQRRAAQKKGDSPVAGSQ